MKMFQDIDFQGVEVFNLNPFEKATTPAEVNSLLADGGKYVTYSPDSSVLNHQGLIPNKIYALGSDGQAYQPLTQEVLLTLAIAQAGGADLQKLVNAEQVIEYVQAEKLRALTKLGSGTLNVQYGNGYPVDLLPVDGQVDPDTVYFATVEAGSVVGGETFDSVGFIYGFPSDNTHAGVTWRAIDPFDGIATISEVTEGSSALVTSAGIWSFVKGIESSLTQYFNSQIANINENVNTLIATVDNNDTAINARVDELVNQVGGVSNGDAYVVISMANTADYNRDTGAFEVLASDERITTVIDAKVPAIRALFGRADRIVNIDYKFILAENKFIFNFSPSLDLTDSYIIFVGPKKPTDSTVTSGGVTPRL